MRRQKKTLIHRYNKNMFHSYIQHFKQSLGREREKTREERERERERERQRHTEKKNRKINEETEKPIIHRYNKKNHYYIQYLEYRKQF